MANRFTGKKNERGVTILIVAVSLAALIAMAALAIDIASLYSIRSEAQRAANAAALAGARMIADSGITSRPSAYASTGSVCATGGGGLAAPANRQAEAAVTANLIAGQPATVTAVNCDFSVAGNPKIKITVQRTGLPSFFARVGGFTSNTVTATATAEAYNPSGGAAANTTPIELTDVKPWMIPNCDATAPGANLTGTCLILPGGILPLAPGFVNPDGTMHNNGSFIGHKVFFRRVTGPTLSLTANTIPFYPVDLPTESLQCPRVTEPSCNGLDSTPSSTQDIYLANIACSSSRKLKCGDEVKPADSILALLGSGYGTLTRQGSRCLSHADDDDLDEGQDEIFQTTANTPPVRWDGGSNNPNSNLAGRHGISRSDSIVTVPLFDGINLCPALGICLPIGQKIIGFMQLGITRSVPPSHPSGAHFEAVILNVAGCGSTAGSNYVSDGGSSPIPARLIQTP